jgi:hypothetical protein
MTRSNRHRIQRQILELSIGAAAHGATVHNELDRPFWDRAVQELEQVFDGSAGPDELLRLDRLELDLGTIGGGADWPGEFRRKLIAELARSLAQFTAASEEHVEDRPGDRRRAEPWRQFLFFLTHGRLPWWGPAPEQRWDDLLSKVSDEDWSALREAVSSDPRARSRLVYSVADEDWSALRETVSSDPRARSRLVYSVDDEFLDAAIVVWSGVRDAARVLEQLTPARLDAHARRRWRRGFWITVLDWVATGGFRAPRGGSQLVRDLMIVRQMYDPAIGPSAGRRPSDGDDAGGDRAQAVEGGDLPEPWRRWWRAQGEAAPFERAVPEARADPGTRSDRSPVVSPPRAAAWKQVPRARDEEAIYLGGAGVILVHPFLEQLFRERELLEGRYFRGLEARDRAVHLIGSLTFGRVEVPEHHLVLAKVLCGAAMEDPLEPVRLEDDDLAACDALLRAVLDHWTALRSSSPDWLREQFFLREGKLERVDSGYRLTIERRAQDVLLARLPWGCGVVPLPWLTERVFVHWLD